MGQDLDEAGVTLNQKEIDGEADERSTQRPLIQGAHGNGNHKASALETRQNGTL